MKLGLTLMLMVVVLLVYGYTVADIGHKLKIAFNLLLMSGTVLIAMGLLFWIWQF